MMLCYVDESGCTGVLPSATSPIQPLIVIGGIIIDYGKLHSVTESYLGLKQRFFPNLFSTDRRYFLTGILSEIKGADLRRNVASGGRNSRRHVFGFLDGVIRIMEENSISVLGRVWIKGIATSFDGRSVYTFSSQSICTTFQECLREKNDLGAVIFDARTQPLNKQVAHSIFTQKFRMSGDAFDRIVDLPTFAHSDNMAGLQIADLVSSGIVFPIASYTYCSGLVHNAHVNPKYRYIKDRYAATLRALQFRYKEANGRCMGGIVVSDTLTHRCGSELFH